MSDSTLLDRAERMLYLRTVPVIGTLPAAELATVAEATRDRFFRRGEILLRPDARVHAAYMVVEGRVDVLRDGHLIRRVGPRGVVGDLAMLSRAEEHLEWRAERDTLALELKGAMLLELFEEHFAIFTHVLARLAGRAVDLLREGAGPLRFPETPFDSGAVSTHDGLDLVERILVVRRLPAIAFPVDVLVDLATHLEEVRFEEGDVLWEAGDGADDALIIADGALRGEQPGRRRAIAWEPGSIMGILEALAGRPRWYTARATKRGMGLRASRETLVDVFEDDVALAREVVGYLAARVLELLERTVTEPASTARPGTARPGAPPPRPPGAS
ncbi:MAG: Crp/Fnr family transcriptional regulator [Myxococcota bacterium]